jgi:hypothetical protein
MKTPTSALERPAVSDRTPAAPASSATTNDHRSGVQMKPVSGRGSDTSELSIQPTAAASSASTIVTAIATAKPATSSRIASRSRRGRQSAIPTQAAATGPNSGPTTIAPTTRIAESRTTAIAAIVVARQRNA